MPQRIAPFLFLPLLCCSGVRAQDTPAVADQYLDCLERFQEYARTIWHDSAEPPESGYFGDGASGGNGGIRGTCGVLLSYATLLRAGRGDRDELLGALRKGLRYAALTHHVADHRCRDGKQWGGSWQSSLWAGSLGFAAALAADELSPDLIRSCKQVVAYEADRLAKIPPASGWRGDSKAEENAWNSNVLALAVAWMPEDPRAPTWSRATKAYLANTYSVEDTSADPLREWVTTTTLHPSFTCENHGFFHPSYQMVSGMSMGDSLLMATALDPAVAADLAPFAEHNVLPVWRRLSQVLLDSGELAYPSGLDWALHGYGQISYLAWMATHFGDPLARWAEQRLASHLAARQRITGDGRFTGDSVPNGFYREAVMARRVAMAWWQHELGRHRAGPATPPPDFVEHMPDVKLILQRTPEGFVSLSYGARVMAMVVPSAVDDPARPYVTTPRYPGLIGPGVFGNPGGATTQIITATQEGFEAQLTISFGPLESREVKFAGFGDSAAIIEAPSVMLDMPDTRRAAFPVGIENHELTGGERELRWDAGSQRIEAMSAERITVSGNWACVAERLGYVAGPEGAVQYHAASRYNRRGAAEDHLHFTPDAHALPRYAILLPSADSATTRAVAQTVTWRTDAGSARLEFVSPRGQRRVLRMELPMGMSEKRTLVRAKQVTAGTQSEKHPARLALDGDPATFWVSSNDGSIPGHGPTSERPEWLEFELGGEAEIDEIIVLPRVAYGPKEVSLALDGDTVYEGKMTRQPLIVSLEEPVKPTRARLIMTSSYDPRFPDQPRNVQVAEVIFTLRRPVDAGSRE